MEKNNNRNICFFCHKPMETTERWIGDKQNGICIRNEDDDGVADEIVMYIDGKCVMHLEAMSDFYYNMGLYAGDNEAHVNIGSRSLQSIVDAKVQE